MDGVGHISVPLAEECAVKLIARADKSPFGHKMETKMDESVRKSWQLEPDIVHFKNPQWHSGLEQLVQLIAQRLGYPDVALQCVLYKMLVYGEGGHFVKHQDTEKENGMIAALVVQLPSTHEGGDLVVYRGGKVSHRHDFGEADHSRVFPTLRRALCRRRARSGNGDWSSCTRFAYRQQFATSRKITTNSSVTSLQSAI